MAAGFAYPQLPNSWQRYDTSRSYDWNYRHAPEWPREFRGGGSGGWQLCGVEVGSPIGIAAGPLLNGRWCLHYAAAGFDLVTYKTVRSCAWPCYPPPNLLPVEPTELWASPQDPLPAADSMSGSWAVSFGMPSKDPAVWRRDVEETRRRLPKENHLSVSVVATPQSDWTLEQVGDDYAQCARWAVESGADFVELNFSCPNVATCDGQLFQQPAAAAAIAQRVRRAVGSVPLLIKIGHVQEADLAQALLAQLAGTVHALVMINCLGAKVKESQGLAFAGKSRGIAGPAIRPAVLTQLELFQEARRRVPGSPELVGVGGVRGPDDVNDYLQRGAAAVQLATAVMWP